MFAQYVFNGSATVANLISDLSAILTGTTDVNSLSAGCDKAATSIISTEPAGWTLWDTQPTYFVIRALNLDGQTYKYVRVTPTLTNYNFNVYESHNAVTHVGTNAAYNTGNIGSVTVGHALFLSASVRGLGVHGRTPTNSWNDPLICGEYTRDDPWNTPANGYPCTFQMLHSEFCANSSSNPGSNTGQGAPVPRLRTTGTDLLTSAAILRGASKFMVVPQFGPNLSANRTQSFASPGALGTLPRGANFTTDYEYPIAEMFLFSNMQNLGYYYRGGKILGNFYEMMPYGSPGDEIIHNGQLYHIAKTTATNPAFLFPKW